ncbi:Outer membrane receptor proteins, mostly Fe transport [Halpernia humi]|uniref:Outer membrane receptor proteins, mostly Fe transport n=1 Tax=Halpernia humi TaxID=493375 RepID=A0A1H5XZB2_9FLAO|nr:TonB-dependent receptor [Halpernia humi]SEG17041.1 Outer membrane receptor proteins, mostly Fe transport [Halpernia humi]
MNLVQKSMFTALITLSTASVYYAQSVKTDTLSKENAIDEVVISGVADIAKDRKTPVAVSTIKEAQIVEKLGNQEFPEILNSTPSVYATKGGGGFGDAKLNIRGFAQENIAVMINGVPVNDMENGAVYWSNWAGLSDVTSAMQVQRGLGSSKLAIASVGGTVNIITRAADRREGGRVSLGVGNDGYVKTGVAYNTGKNAKGWSSSFLLTRTGGSTYASGTQFEGYNYYFALGYQKGKHDFQFTLTGAPQYHNQRSYEITLQTLIDRGSMDRPDRRYNQQEGVLNGKEYTFRRNYYHKPVMSLNWDYKISPSSKLSTVGYASFGRGGGTGDLGSVGGKRASAFVNADGLTDFDAIIAANAASTPDKGVLIRRSSINSHNWFGLISNFNHKINDNLNFSVGIDTRYYHGYHYQVVSDLLGASAYKDYSNQNNTPNYVSNTFKANPNFNPFGGKVNSINDQIAYSNDGEVLWYGGFGQIEYSNDRISAFVQGAVSNQGFQRIDNFIIDGGTTLNGKVVSATNQPSATNPLLYKKTGFKNLVGYNAKGGLNFNIDEHSNVFVNAGYYSKQPFLNAVYPNNKNFLNPNLTNEKILGFEAGYGFRASWLNANVNAYRTNWKDRFLRRTQQINPGGGLPIINAYANIQGIEEIHQGLEFEAKSKINDIITINAMFAVADWHYNGNASGTLFNETNEPIDDNGNVVASGQAGVRTLYLDKIKVGDAAQMTGSLGFTLTPVRDFKFDASYRYVNHLYANLNVLNFSDQTAAAKGALELPSYGLVELGASYKFRLPNKKQSFTVRANVYNLLNTYYIQNSYTNTFAGDKYSTGVTYKGIDTGNQVFFGFGRTWSTTVAYNF